MSSIQVLSTTTIYAPNHSNDHTIDLTPWDLQFLPFEVNQKGLLYRHPLKLDTSNQIQHLKQSLSSTLEFFPPFTGRLKITEHGDNNISCFITCNNEGALFVHAAAEKTSVDDILGPTYLPRILHSFFPLNGVKNYQGTSEPLLVIQVTELVDGIFIGCAINHMVCDGTSIWRFINSWAKASKGCFEKSKIPSFERWFPKFVQHPIRFHFTIESQNNHSSNDIYKEEKPNSVERTFHFTKGNIAKLKLKANLEAGTKNISSLQALLTHIWRSIIRSKNLDPEEEVNYVVVIGVRPRLIPPLKENYFGNAMLDCMVTMKAGELLEDGGLGKGAWEMNKKIALHSDEKLKNHYENWLKTPSFISVGMFNSETLITGSSPRFDVYGNDFGWGKPVAVPIGGEENGNIYVSAGVEEGSMDLQVCLPYETLEAIGNDTEFMEVVSN
ncbi:protein ENHANCED PSEUDOMONAS SUSCEPTIBILITY 1-like [Vicia villosa]|uniref:protein ENHANCED PSEUDOMONAS SUSCEPTIBILITY 1-like n=1 Tax=Vicia villosa TaxID=3911 RepID=UPI00273AE1E6|nr:protein ENHANCED PSEUDOMONAS SUSCEPTIBILITY 1-like [Vicia villosa]